MEQRGQIAWYAPNMISICVDHISGGEMSGRIYHFYRKEPLEFGNIVQMMEMIDVFFDDLRFPQASTSARSFVRAAQHAADTLSKEVTPEAIAAYRGEVGTFLLSVRYRQNSSWQGAVRWIEGNQIYNFVSELELIKVLSNSVELRQ